MRADRLLSILMLLQARGRLKASELARELEVSERTIYRDLDALSTAGVPVYAQRGPGGGCALIDNYRTRLTGLNAGEVRALFTLSPPTPLADLGMAEELQTAFRKLAASLPDTHRRAEERVRQRIHLDDAGWLQADEPVPHLQTIQRAVWEDRRLQLLYGLEFGAKIDRLVEPYGLVAKAGVWHLVCAVEERLRVYRVSRILVARLLDETFERIATFDLALFWSTWRAGREANRPRYPVTARVSPELVEILPLYFGKAIRYELESAPPADAEGWCSVTLPFESLEAARARILGFGRSIEVLEPVALRRTVVDFAMQIVDFYAR